MTIRTPCCPGSAPINRPKQLCNDRPISYAVSRTRLSCCCDSRTTATTARGYECLFNYEGNLEIVRWNGPIGNFTPLPLTGNGAGSLGRDLMTGDVIRCTITGNVIRSYINGA